VQQYKEAVAGLIAQEEKKMTTLSRLNEEVGQLERLRQGAAAKAKSSVAALKAKGLNEEQIRRDEEYKKCLSAFNDFSSTLQEKNARIAELENDLKNYAKNIGDHKVQLQQLLRDLDKLKSEATDAVAEVLTAKEEKEIADMISGISEDRTDKELAQMRDMRSEMRASARVSRELAGTDTKRSEAEFLEYAHVDRFGKFDQLIGLASKADKEEAEAPEREAERSKLPEH
jgi:chromosome segregation ATPase